MTGQDWLESGAYWLNVPDGVMAFINRIGLPESLYNDKAKAFAANTRSMTGKSDVESYAMEAYDSIAILAQAINEAGSTDGDAIVEALENIEYDGVLGKIYFPYGTQQGPERRRQGRRELAPVAGRAAHHAPVHRARARPRATPPSSGPSLQDRRAGLGQRIDAGEGARLHPPGRGPADAAGATAGAGGRPWKTRHILGDVILDDRLGRARRPADPPALSGTATWTRPTRLRRRHDGRGIRAGRAGAALGGDAAPDAPARSGARATWP